MSPKSRWLPLAVSLALLLLAGCQSGPSGSLQNGQLAGDPLTGGGPPLPPANTSASVSGRGSAGPLTIPGPGTVARPAGPLPPLPTPSGSTSPAALTSGAASMLDQAAPLRIASTAPVESPHATLQPPSPVVVGGVETTPAVPLPVTQVAHLTDGTSVDQLVKTLQDRGGLQPGVQLKNGQWLCTCRVADPKNNNLLHCYEATADTSVAAVQAVLDQIDRDRR